MPFGERSTSVQPVNRFSRFQALSPCRSRTSLCIVSLLRCRPIRATTVLRVKPTARGQRSVTVARSLMPMNPLRVIGRFPRPVRLLILGTLVNKLGTFILPYLALVLLRDFHLSEGDAAKLLFAYGTGSLVSILAGGVLTDWLGRRRTLLVSLFGSGALAVSMGVAPKAQLLVAFSFVGELYRPAASAMIGDLLPSSERSSGFAGLRMAVNLGWASGTALGGVLADWNWRLLFLGDGLTTLAYGLIVYFLIPDTRPGLVLGA